MIAQVIEREPDFSALPPGTTPSIRRLLRRTLVKDPHHRLHDIADARLELVDADVAEAPPASGAAVASRRPSRIAPLAATLFLAIAGLSWMTLRGAPDTPARVSRFEIVPPAFAPLRDGGDETRLFAISPDGTRVAYLTTRGLAVRALDRLDVVVLDAPNIGFFPFFSPDGKWIAGTLDGVNKVSVAGGPVIRLADTAAGAIGAWGDDGIVFADVNGLFRVSADGGRPERLPLGALGPSEQVTFPEPLPGRRAVLFTVISTKSNTLGDSATSSTARIEALDLDSGARTVVVRGGGRPRYLPVGSSALRIRRTLVRCALRSRTVDDPRRAGAARRRVGGVRRVQRRHAACMASASAAAGGSWYGWIAAAASSRWACRLPSTPTPVSLPTAPASRWTCPGRIATSGCGTSSAR